MPPKRKRIVGSNPLEDRPRRVETLPGEDLSLERSSDGRTPSNEHPLLQGPKKLFAYKLPVALGTKFKLYCHARGKTAEGVLAELLADFLKDKKIDPTE